MKAEVKRRPNAREFETHERCHVREMANEASDAEVSIARIRVAPGVTTAWHRLQGVNERYIILSGEGLMDLGALAPIAVAADDVVRIPAGIRQRITNTGVADLIFLAVCTPRFTPGCYVHLA